jgi:class 3 adenylate cyclase
MAKNLQEQHFSTMIFAAYLRLMRREYPSVDLEALSARAGLSLSYLEDSKNWVSADFAKTFTELCIEACASPDLPRRAGQESATEELLGHTVYRLVRYLLPLESVYKKIPELTSFYNKLVTVSVLGAREGLMRLRYELSAAALELDPAVRDKTLESSFANILEYYAAIPTIQGLPPARVRFVRVDSGFEVEIVYVVQRPWLALIPVMGAIAAFFVWPKGWILLSGLLATVLIRHRQLSKGTDLTLDALVKTDQRYMELFKSNEEQRILKDSYSRFVPWQLVDLLKKKSILEVSVGDFVQAPMTVVFSDIRDFTRISESLTAEESFRFLNSYLAKISPAVREHGGFVDNFFADGILAIFPGTPQTAVDAALDISERLEVYNQHRKSAGYEAIRVGIGVHSGPVALGTIGNPQQMRGTVISDTANTASRLESLTKVLGVERLISSSVRDQLEPMMQSQTRFLGWAVLKGKREMVPVWELFTAQAAREFEVHRAAFDDLLAALASEQIVLARDRVQALFVRLPDDRFLGQLWQALDRVESIQGLGEIYPLRFNPLGKARAA